VANAVAPAGSAAACSRSLLSWSVAARSMNTQAAIALPAPSIAITGPMALVASAAGAENAPPTVATENSTAPSFCQTTTASPVDPIATAGIRGYVSVPDTTTGFLTGAPAGRHAAWSTGLPPSQRRTVVALAPHQQRVAARVDGQARRTDASHAARQRVRGAEMAAVRPDRQLHAMEVTTVDAPQRERVAGAVEGQ
jgi:hypothetical protein